jgi:hypothetical protein
MVCLLTAILAVLKLSDDFFNSFAPDVRLCHRHHLLGFDLLDEDQVIVPDPKL